MRRLFFITVVSMLLTVPAVADMARVKMTQGPGVGNGGAFNAEVISGAISYGSVNFGPGARFPTFCIELTEYFNPDSTYYADSRIAAYGGGAGGGEGSPLRDYLDPRTAALYTQYLGLKTLDGDTASLYQLAIWKVEQEIQWDAVNSKWLKFGTTTFIHSDYQGKSEFHDDVIQGLYIASVGTPTTIGNVRVMTLWNSYDAVNDCFSGNRQDQLVVVPIPAAVLLGLLGLGVAGIKLRKFA